MTVNNLRLELNKNPKQKTIVHGNVITLSKLRFNSDAYENGCLSLHQFKDYEILIKLNDGDATIVWEDEKFVFLEDSKRQNLSKYEFILGEEDDEEEPELTQVRAKPRKLKLRNPFKFK